MPWISFLLALACFAIAMKTQSIGLALVCLLAALGLMLWGALSLVAARIQNNSQGPLGLNPAIERQRLKGVAGGAAAAMPAVVAAAQVDAGSDTDVDTDTDVDVSDGDGDDGNNPHDERGPQA